MPQSLLSILEEDHIENPFESPKEKIQYHDNSLIPLITKLLFIPGYSFYDSWKLNCEIGETQGISSRDLFLRSIPECAFVELSKVYLTIAPLVLYFYR